MSELSRRRALQLAAAGAARLSVPDVARALLPGKTKLAPRAFEPLALGEILPAGWLRAQLAIQARGMSGHLDEFWPDVGENSGWLGGTGERWERGPYFADGLFPLAVLLQDESLKRKAMKFIDWTLDHAAANGMIGPAGNDDWWPRMVMVKVLAQYCDATSDPRVVPVLTRYFHYQLASLPDRPLTSWGKYRWQDEALIVEWLYDRTGDGRLLDLVALLQGQGFDWVANFRPFRSTEPATRALLKMDGGTENSAAGMQTHGVNHGQAIKTAAVRFRMNGQAEEKGNLDRQLASLDRYHGMPNGMFSCDEHLAGLDPSHGTELCTVVETMFSLEVALATFGDAGLGDRLEKIAFNALPGTFTDDMWAHQYDQQPNQIQVSLNSKPWTTNGPESNLYGLEPNFGCCTANFHQGWPKLAASLWMRPAEGGLAACVYAPCVVSTSVKGRRVTVAVETEYPFREMVQIRVELEGELAFPVLLRIPGWADGATVLVNGKAVEHAAQPGTFLRLERTWAAGDLMELNFGMKPKVTRWFKGSVALNRGPIVFSLSPGESWVKLRQRGPTADWQVFPTRPWNYALDVDEASVAEVKVTEHSVPMVPFSAAQPPVTLEVRGHRMDAWRAEDGVAGVLAVSPVKADGTAEVLTLIPYGAAKLRVTAFPQVQRG